MLFDCLFLVIPATNLDDTKTIFDNEATNLLMVNIVHKCEVCAILLMTKVACLVNVTMIQIFESCYTHV
jgi:hypothetical protein